MVNIYINKNSSINCYPTLENCLFGAVNLTKNADIDKYKYFGYGIEFDRKGTFSFGNGIGRNGIIFAVDMSPSEHVDNKTTRHISIVGEEPKQEAEDATFTADKKDSIIFTENSKKLYLSLHYNDQIVIYLLMVQKLLNSKLLKL